MIILIMGYPINERELDLFFSSKPKDFFSPGN